MEFPAINNLPLMLAMRQRMSYLTDRQQVIAQNISNANTPEYRAQDIMTPDFQKMVKQSHGRLRMMVTSKSHLPGNMIAMPSFKVEDDPNATEFTPVGNNVVLEEQAMKLADTGHNYQETTKLYRKITEMIRLAAEFRV